MDGGGVDLEALRRRVRALEGIPGEASRSLPLSPDLAPQLPDGRLPLGCVHEISSSPDGSDPFGGAATGFASLLASRIGGPVLWLRRGGRRGDAEPYAPGLAVWGLGPSRLVVVRAGSDKDLLWALEESLRCHGVGAVVAEPARMDITAGRRLQLAAEAGGATALLVRPADAKGVAGSAVTRWRVSPAPGAVEDREPGVGAARWCLELLRCRGGSPGAWLARWTGGGLAASPLRNAPASDSDAGERASA